MFRGVYNLTVDAKGRMKIPSKQQKQTAAEKTAPNVFILSVHPDDSCLVLYPFNHWQTLEENINALPSLDIHVKRLRRRLIGYATEVDIDSGGRILIPQPLRDYAQLDKKVILSGQGRNFEIWDEQTWHSNLENLDKLSQAQKPPEALVQLSI